MLLLVTGETARPLLPGYRAHCSCGPFAYQQPGLSPRRVLHPVACLTMFLIPNSSELNQPALNLSSFPSGLSFQIPILLDHISQETLLWPASAPHRAAGRAG